jgi:hypothetical protein
MKSMCFPPSAFCLLPTADCIWGWRDGEGSSQASSPGQDVASDNEIKN